MPTIDLLSLVLTLRVQSIIEHPHYWWGKSVHGMLLNVINQIDPQLNRQLHEAADLRPFTTSTLLGLPVRSPVNSQQTCQIRLTALREDIARLFTTLAQNGAFCPGQEINLDGQLFRIESASVNNQSDPLAMESNYQALAASHLVATSMPADEIQLRFTSPVFFQSSGRMIPFPLPDMVFGSLLDRWNNFSPLPLPTELRRYAWENIRVHRFNLDSRSIYVTGGTQVGAQGTIHYKIDEKAYDRYWVNLLHILADFSFFAGVGAKTTMGLGQCQPCQFAHNAPIDEYHTPK